MNLCVAKNGEDLVKKINQLQEDPFFYRQLQSVGYEQYQKQTTDVVADELYRIFSKTVQNFTGEWNKYP